MRALELKGLRFGNFLVLDRSTEKTKKKETRWDCLCECGKTFVASGWRIKKGKILDCGVCRLKNAVLKGKKFGSWTVLCIADKQNCLCECECSARKLVYVWSLMYGKSKSCGCKKIKKHQKRYKGCLKKSHYNQSFQAN